MLLFGTNAGGGGARGAMKADGGSCGGGCCCATSGSILIVRLSTGLVSSGGIELLLLTGVDVLMTLPGVGAGDEMSIGS